LMWPGRQPPEKWVERLATDYRGPGLSAGYHSLCAMGRTNVFGILTLSIPFNEFKNDHECFSYLRAQSVPTIYGQ
jgi:hypothetical protein